MIKYWALSGSVYVKYRSVIKLDQNYFLNILMMNKIHS